MPKFECELKNKKTKKSVKINEDDLFNFNKKTIYSSNAVYSITCDFAGNKVFVDSKNKVIKINDEVIDLGFVPKKVPVKLVNCRRIRKVISGSDDVKKVDFYIIGWEDEEDKATRLVFLDKHGLWKLRSSRKVKKMNKEVNK